MNRHYAGTPIPFGYFLIYHSHHIDLGGIGLRLQASLTPAEGKRIIGMSIAAMEAVRHDMEEGTMVIATSTTTAYVLEELLVVEIPDKGMFTAGVIAAGGCCVTDPKGRHGLRVIRRGEPALKTAVRSCELFGEVRL